MEDKPLVSVGLPVFNGEETIFASLDALKDQTYQNIEIIIGDNASTDGTEDLCRRFADRESRCKYFRSDVNRGAPSNFNFVFRQSTGSLFLWTAADDVLDSKFIELGVRFLIANPKIVLAAPLTRVWLPGVDVPIYSCVVDGLGRGTRGLKRIVNSYTQLPMHSIYGLFRRDVIDGTCMLNSVLGSDVAFMQEVALRGPVETNRLQILDYHARPRWNSSVDDLRMFSGDNIESDSRHVFSKCPAVRLLWDRVTRIWKLEQSCLYRSVATVTVGTLEACRILFMLLNRLLQRVLGQEQHRRWILWVYWRFLHSPDIFVQESAEYTERVIMARFK